MFDSRRLPWAGTSPDNTLQAMPMSEEDLRTARGRQGEGRSQPYLVYVTQAQLLHFLQMDLCLDLTDLSQPPSTPPPVGTETAAEDDEGRE